MNNNQSSMNFAQRNWLLLCVIVAIVSVVGTYFSINTHSSLLKESDIKTSTSSAEPGMDSAGIPPDSLHH